MKKYSSVIFNLLSILPVILLLASCQRNMVSQNYGDPRLQAGQEQLYADRNAMMQVQLQPFALKAEPKAIVRTRFLSVGTERTISQIALHFRQGQKSFLKKSADNKEPSLRMPNIRPLKNFSLTSDKPGHDVTAAGLILLATGLAIFGITAIWSIPLFTNMAGVFLFSSAVLFILLGLFVLYFGIGVHMYRKEKGKE